VEAPEKRYRRVVWWNIECFQQRDDSFTSLNRKIRLPSSMPCSLAAQAYHRNPPWCLWQCRLERHIQAVSVLREILGQRPRLTRRRSECSSAATYRFSKLTPTNEIIRRNVFYVTLPRSLQCSVAVGWVTGRASGL